MLEGRGGSACARGARRRRDLLPGAARCHGIPRRSRTRSLGRCRSRPRSGRRRSPRRCQHGGSPPRPQTVSRPRAPSPSSTHPGVYAMDSRASRIRRSSAISAHACCAKLGIAPLLPVNVLSPTGIIHAQQERPAEVVPGDGLGCRRHEQVAQERGCRTVLITRFARMEADGGDRAATDPARGNTRCAVKRRPRLGVGGRELEAERRVRCVPATRQRGRGRSRRTAWPAARPRWTAPESAASGLSHEGARETSKTGSASRQRTRASTCSRPSASGSDASTTHRVPGPGRPPVPVTSVLQPARCPSVTQSSASRSRGGSQPPVPHTGPAPRSATLARTSSDAAITARIPGRGNRGSALPRLPERRAPRRVRASAAACARARRGGGARTPAAA